MPRKKVSKRRTTRKTSTKKKKTVTKQPARRLTRNSVTTSSDAAHFDVQMNPFSTATPQPKILDGAFTSSLSRRLQSVEEIANVSGGSIPSNEMWVIFSPTFGIPVTAFNTSIGKQRRSQVTWYPQYIGFNNQSCMLQNTSVGNPSNVVWPPTQTGNYELVNQSGFSSWRIVSSGLRLELANTDEENDGWFEAFRFNWNQNPSHLNIAALNGYLSNNQLGVGLNNNCLGYVQGVPATEQRGYTSGLLKDISKFEFNLHPQTSTHDPCMLKNKNDYQEGQQLVYNTNDKTLTPSNGNLLSNQLIDQFVDNNMDWICLKLHTRNATTGIGSKLVCNVVQNIEFTVNPTNDLATFQTTNKRNSSQAGFRDTLNNRANFAKRTYVRGS